VVIGIQGVLGVHYASETAQVELRSGRVQAPGDWRCGASELRASSRSGSSRRGGRGIHSSTFRLNLNAFCDVEGAFRGCSGGV